MEVVAWLALALAVISFGWQVYEAARRRRRRIEVRVHHLAVPGRAGRPLALLLHPAVSSTPTSFGLWRFRWV